MIEATLAEDNQAIGELVVPDKQAAEMLDLFGFAVFDILLKTVLGRPRLGLSRAIETDNGRYVFIEYAWPDPGATGNAYTPLDVVSVKLERLGDEWRVAEINPASADLPLTESSARTILVTSKALSEEGKMPAEPWILPLALYGGVLQIALQTSALVDPVEEALLSGLQKRAYGVMSLIRGRRLWRDFRERAQPDLSKPAAWAAAVEFIMNEQNMRNLTQATVGKHYQVNLATLIPRIKQIKHELGIHGLDERYTDIQTTEIIYSDEDE
jgi:hypothetical protein